MRYAIIDILDGRVENIIELNDISNFFLSENFFLKEYDDLDPARMGGYWLNDIGVFTEPQPFPSWKLDRSNGEWFAPIPMPNNGNQYAWIEDTQEWFLIPNSDYEVQ